jgi:hypothetical protein
VHKPKSIKELLKVGPRLTDLKAKSQHRTLVLAQVCAALPPKLAENVVSAGIDHGRLTVGVTAAPWAARLRYVTETLRTGIGSSMGVDIHSIRIKVVPPRT